MLICEVLAELTTAPYSKWDGPAALPKTRDGEMPERLSDVIGDMVWETGNP